MFEIYKKNRSIPMSNDEINFKLSLLPEQLYNKISKYSSNEKKQQRLDGLTLLSETLKKNNRDEKDIFLIYYNDFGKPFITSDIDFSISYAGNITVLGFLKNGSIGVDVEQIRPIDCKQFKDYFTKNEWDILTQNRYANNSFFKLWTRKEAVAKALGTGVFIGFNTFEVIDDIVCIDNNMIQLFSEAEDGFCWSVACII